MTDGAYWERRWAGFRAGRRRVRLSWGGGSALAVLYEDGVPRTVAAVAAALPLTLELIHVAWSGDMVMTSSAVSIDAPFEENTVRLPQPGDLGWDPKVKELTVTYGVAECHTPAQPNTICIYGQIVEGLEAFAQFGRARRYEGLGELEMSLDD